MAIIFGAAPDTGNQGVTALAQSAVHALAQRGVTDVALADNGRGMRRETWRLAGLDCPVRRVGIGPSRRLWRPEALATFAASVRLGGIGNAGARAFLAAPAVLDVSGGDSFTDLYGQRRFDAITMPKELAVASGRPLILLPQTIGPFRSAANRERGRRVLAGAAMVWTRDAASLAALAALLDEDFDPRRHRAGVDMAVRLPATAPAALPEEVGAWLCGGGPVAGLNVSGLLANRPQEARVRFGLAADHLAVMEGLARALLAADPALRIVLVPHVTVDPAHPEADVAACHALEARLGDHASRVATLPNDLTATELKWVIGRLAWFCGARMHSTVAAFSSGVPTLGLAYSGKIAGVFEACGIGGAVADLRREGAGDVAERALASWRERAAMAGLLARLRDAMLRRASEQMDVIAGAILRATPAASALAAKVAA